MQVMGEVAKDWVAIRLDNFEQVNKGLLVEADDYSGTVKWVDSTGNQCSAVLGSHAIRIMRKSLYGR